MLLDQLMGRQRSLDPASTLGVPDEFEPHPPGLIAADASVALLRLASLEVEAHRGVTAPLEGLAHAAPANIVRGGASPPGCCGRSSRRSCLATLRRLSLGEPRRDAPSAAMRLTRRSEEHTSELQSRPHLVC